MKMREMILRFVAFLIQSRLIFKLPIQSQSMRTQWLKKHCQQLIIQMHALIKNLSAEILKFNQEDFDRLRQVAASKYNGLIEELKYS